MSTGWIITWGDLSYTDDDLLVRDVCTAYRVCGAYPAFPFNNPSHLVALVVTLIARNATVPIDLDALVSEIGALPVKQLLDSIELLVTVDVDRE